MTSLVFPLTAALHLAAAYLALRLIRSSAARAAWTFLALGILLSAVQLFDSWMGHGLPHGMWLLAPEVAIVLRGTSGVLLCLGAWQMRRHFDEARRNEVLFHEAFHGANDAVYLMDTTGRIVEANERAADLTGYTRPELQSMRVVDLALPEHVSTSLERVREVLERGAARFERIHRRKDGSTVCVEVSARRISVNGQTLVHAIARDLTKRKAAEQALQESEERFSSLFEHSPIGVYRSTPDGRFLMANPALLRLMGCRTQEELAAVDLESHASTVGYDRAQFRQLVEAQGHVHGLETKWRRRDGTEITFIENAHAVRGQDGTVVAYEGTVEDVTERNLLEHELRQSQKIEAVGRLAGGIAHDFNNLLTAILGFTHLVRGHLGDDHPQVESLDKVIRASDRAADLTRQLLAFSRRKVHEVSALDLRTVVASMEPTLRGVLPANVQLRTVARAELGTIRADRAMIEQVVLNLALNARDAMPDGGNLTIGLANAEIDASYARVHPEVRAGLYVLLSVTDSGIGMDATTRSHLFEPFFTTKELGQGTGLGLATVYGIVRQSEGHVAVYSEPGLGTSLKVYLPRDDEPPGRRAESSGDEAVPRGAETVLLVDDEPSVIEFAQSVLADLGYAVIVAPSGESALEVSAAHPGPIDLVLTDVVMPGLSGRQLVERLSATRSPFRALYMSGYMDDAIVLHGILQQEALFLQKPFTPPALGRSVRMALDQLPSVVTGRKLG